MQTDGLGRFTEAIAGILQLDSLSLSLSLGSFEMPSDSAVSPLEQDPCEEKDTEDVEQQLT